MVVIIESVGDEWIEISDPWNNNLQDWTNNADSWRETLRKLVEQIEGALDIINKTPYMKDYGAKITDKSTSEFYRDIDELLDEAKLFVSFTQGIHYEISEMVDNPFAINVGKIDEELIAINPSNYTYEKTPGGKTITLPKFIKANADDSELKKSFNSLYKELDKDKMSKELLSAIEEAQYWANEYENAGKIREAQERIFTDEERADWPNKTPEEREEIVKKYLKELSMIMYGTPDRFRIDDMDGGASNFWFDTITDDPKKLGYTDGDGNVTIKQEFLYNSDGAYDIDNLIDTITHETRHAYQTGHEAPDRLTLIFYESNERIGENQYYYRPNEEDARAWTALIH